MGIDVTDGYPMEMHQVYVLWFLWGFWAKIVFVGLFLVIMPVGYFAPKTGQILGGLTCASYLINGGIWLAFGAIWRFSKAGSIASGDKLEKDPSISDSIWKQQLEASSQANGFQLKGGFFMYVYLTAMMILFATIIFGFVVGCMVLCCCDPRSKGDGEPYEQLENEQDDLNDEDRERSSKKNKRNKQ